MEAPFALDRAIAVIGSQAALAAAIGVSQQVISYWIKKGHRVPAERVVAVEAATGIARHELRPDIFGPPLTAASIDAIVSKADESPEKSGAAA